MAIVRSPNDVHHYGGRLRRLCMPSGCSLFLMPRKIARPKQAAFTFAGEEPFRVQSNDDDRGTVRLPYDTAHPCCVSRAGRWRFARSALPPLAVPIAEFALGEHGSIRGAAVA